LTIQLKLTKPPGPRHKYKFKGEREQSYGSFMRFKKMHRMEKLQFTFTHTVDINKNKFQD